MLLIKSKMFPSLSFGMMAITSSTYRFQNTIPRLVSSKNATFNELQQHFDNIKILDADDNMIRRRFLESAYSIANDNSYNRHFELPEIYRPLLRECCMSN